MPVAPSKSILSPACAAVSNTRKPCVSSVASSRAISPLDSLFPSVPSFVIVSNAILPTLVIFASLNEVAPRVFAAAVDVIPPDAVINCEAFTVNAVEPPVATVITSEPLNVMLESVKMR